jgi:hypothetical protein
MLEFMSEHDVTWDIAFSRRSVIDPRYDVWGIPHLTIIDGRGIVRHNNLNPAQLTLDQLKELIDPLAAEN